MVFNFFNRSSIHNIYSYNLNILNNIVKNRVYKTSFFRYLYHDLYHTFYMYRHKSNRRK